MSTIMFSQAALPLQNDRGEPFSGFLCAVCAGAHKAAVIEARKDIISRREADGKDELVWIGLPPPSVKLPPVMPAITCSVVPQCPQLGAVPVCLTHMPGIDTRPRAGAGLALANGALPPGLAAGR